MHSSKAVANAIQEPANTSAVFFAGRSSHRVANRFRDSRESPKGTESVLERLVPPSGRDLPVRSTSGSLSL